MKLTLIPAALAALTLVGCSTPGSDQPDAADASPTTEPAQVCKPYEYRGTGADRERCKGSGEGWRDAPETRRVPRPAQLSDFFVALRVTENQCYDSAGALITFEPTLGYGDDGNYEGRATVVYEVTQTGDRFSIDIEDGRYSSRSHHLSTDDCPYALTARVVDVVERS